jgi:pimeloyl-ACP methyl ester carboxylesterase
MLMIIATDSFKLAVYSQGNSDSAKLAVVLPGFLDTKDHPHMRSHVDFLANHGSYALSFDPPGTLESEGDISLYTMTNWLKSIEELITHFDSRPTFTMGTSRGGSMAMLAAIRDPRFFAFAAVMSKASYAPDAYTIHPIDDWKQKGYQIFTPRVPGNPDQKKEFKVPYSAVEDTQQYNMLEALGALTKPKLFIEGTNDTTVKPEVVRAAYETAAEPKQLSAVNSDHMYRRHPDVIKEVNHIVAEFLNKEIDNRVETKANPYSASRKNGF